MLFRYFTGSLRLFPVVLGLALSAHAQEYRSSMPAPAYQIYKNMLKLAEKGDHSKIATSLEFLDKIFAQEQHKFSVNIKKEVLTALDKKQKPEIIKALQKAVFYDIKDIFYTVRNSKQESAKTLKLWLRMAAVDYELLSPVVKGKSFKTNEEIIKAFNQGTYILSVEASPLAEEKTTKDIDFTALAKVLSGIEANILTVFPDFK